MTQQDLVYELIKSKNRVFTHELNEFACQKHIHINNPGGRARELKAQGKIWRMDERLKKSLFPDCKEDIWSVIPEDKEEPKPHPLPSPEPVFLERRKQLIFI